MHTFRRAAARSVSLATATSLRQTCRTTPLPTSSRLVASFPRTYGPGLTCRHPRFFFSATRTLKEEERHEQSNVDSAIEAASETAETAKDATSGAIKSTSEAAGEVKDAASSAFGNVASAVTPDAPAASTQTSPIRTETNNAYEVAKSPSLYAGNLYFQVDENGLQKYFERFGTVISSTVVRDPRGLSKGFGYVGFETQEAADEAREALDGELFEGRRIAVNYAIKKKPATLEGNRHPPSSTLFVGNMSYEMSDKDLNDIFRNVKNVLDVRVAVDRRTGQPRGFAHADFTDVESATDAMTMLGEKEMYGRKLKIDFGVNKLMTPKKV